MNFSLPLAAYTVTQLPFEMLLILISLGLASLLKPQSVHWCRRLRSWFRRIAQSPGRLAILLFLLSLAINTTLSAIHTPVPWIHDEYSYLLAADTFAQGRVTNPTHPMSAHFETFHVLQHPTYMSKYPPGTGLMLGIGQRLIGHPIGGAWLGLASATVAVYWMLLAWLPRRWAAIGGMATAIHAPIVLCWGQTYWGGTVAMIGGALVFGSLRRVWSHPTVRHTIVLSAGLVMLANSRPLEGLLASLPVFAALVRWTIFDQRWCVATKLTRVVLPGVLCGVCGITIMLAYNRAITGNAWRMPYQVHDKQYAASSLLIWNRPPRIPEYTNPRFETLYVDWGRQRQLSLQNFSNYVQNVQNKLSLTWDFFTFAGGMCLLGLARAVGCRWCALGCVTIGAILLVELQLATSQLFPHYLAPVFGLFAAISMQSLRHISVWRRHTRLGQLLVRAALVMMILKSTPWWVHWVRPARVHPRQQIVKRLQQQPGKHLVVVDYAEDYSVHAEWVYNRADIDHSKIVWARNLGADRNDRLYEYFSDRRIWHWNCQSLQHVSRLSKSL